MTATNLIVVGLIWAGTGFMAAYFMRRRGHDFSLWLALGVVLGPFIIPLSVERARFHASKQSESAGGPAPTPDGFDVLAGVDGSKESMEAVRSALGLFGDHITSLTIATVLDHESSSRAAGSEPREKARAMLDEVAVTLGTDRVRTEILYGRADRALVDHARSNGVELIVVGARGHGASKALFGSITGRLVGVSETPVYVGPSTIGRRDEMEAANS